MTKDNLTTAQKLRDLIPGQKRKRLERERKEESKKALDAYIENYGVSPYNIP